MQPKTYVFLKTPPIKLPISKQTCCEKKTQVISCSVELVWHFRSNIVGPRNAIQSPKLKNTLQYVSVCCQFRLKSVIRRSSTNIVSSEWTNYWMSGFLKILRLLCKHTLSLLRSKSGMMFSIYRAGSLTGSSVRVTERQVNIWKWGCNSRAVNDFHPWFHNEIGFQRKRLFNGSVPLSCLLRG